MHLDDTIVAVATAPGRGGIGVVRLAGPEARAIAESLLRLRRSLEAGRTVLCELVDSEAGGRIDEGLATYFAKPHSYTTDDIIEISMHGSPVVLSYLVEQAIRRGARAAEPGEFTMRAFLHARIDLTQAEAVRDLIGAQTLYQAKVAAQQLEGALSRRLQPVKRDLVALIATLEAGIDFAEDDVSVLPDEEILRRISSVRAPLRLLAESFAYGKIVHQGLTLAIVGRPNVGKSSLFNCLVERERAIVTATPGTTRDLVTETVSMNGIPVKLIDTAGIRAVQDEDEAESMGIQRSFEALADADLILFVCDLSQIEAPGDAEIEGHLADRSYLTVLNKCDLNGGPRPGRGIPTSTKTGEGIAELRSEIHKHVGGEAGGGEPGFLTSLRHQGLVGDALAGLDAAEAAVHHGIPHEMLVMDLHQSLQPLNALTGETTADDILNLIFSSFCIGK